MCTASFLQQQKIQCLKKHGVFCNSNPMSRLKKPKYKEMVFKKTSAKKNSRLKNTKNIEIVFKK